MRKRGRVAATASAWDQAVSLHAHLATGGHLEPIPVSAHFPLAAGEFALADLAARQGVAMTYERYCAAQVAYAFNPALAIGSPAFVTGAMLGATAQRIRVRRRAEREAAPQWRQLPWVGTVVTNRRLWCVVTDQAGVHQLDFHYQAITHLNLVGSSLILEFGHGAPLRLTGDWAPWCAAIIAHFRYGPTAPHVLPMLSAAARTALIMS